MVRQPLGRKPKTFEDLTRSMVDAIGEVIEKLDVTNNKEFAEAFNNDLFRLPGPTSVSRGPKLSSRDQFISQLFYRFNEIFETKRCIEDIKGYIRTTRAGKDYDSFSRRMNYHISNYLNEIYALQEKIESLVKWLSKQYRSSPKFKKIKIDLDRAIDIVLAALKNPCSCAGAHVHTFRFKDRDISRVAQLELLTKVGDLQPLRPLYELEKRRVRLEKFEALKNNEKTITLLLDHIAIILSEHLFDDDGSIIPPNHQV